MSLLYIVALCDHLGVTQNKHSTHDTFKAATDMCDVAQDYCDRWRPWWTAKVKIVGSRRGEL